MDTTLETQVTEYSVDSPCATGNCPVPTEQVQSSQNKVLCRGDLVIFNLRGRIRTGKVISKGGKFVGIDTIGLQSNTKIPTNTELVPITVFVEKSVLDSLESRVVEVA